MELIEEGNKFKVIVDYAHTPDSMEAVYGSLKPKLAGISKHLRFWGDRRRPGQMEKAGIRQNCEKYCDEIILTNEDPYDEKPEEIIEDIFLDFLIQNSKLKAQKYGKL